MDHTISPHRLWHIAMFTLNLLYKTCSFNNVSKFMFGAYICICVTKIILPVFINTMMISIQHTDTSAIVLIVWIIAHKYFCHIENFILFVVLNDTIANIYNITNNLILRKKYNSAQYGIYPGNLISRISRIGEALRSFKSAIMFSLLPSILSTTYILFDLHNKPRPIIITTISFGVCYLSINCLHSLYICAVARTKAWNSTDLRAAMVLNSYNNPHMIQTQATTSYAPEFALTKLEAHLWYHENRARLINTLLAPIIGVLIMVITGILLGIPYTDWISFAVPSLHIFFTLQTLALSYRSLIISLVDLDGAISIITQNYIDATTAFELFNPTMTHTPSSTTQSHIPYPQAIINAIRPNNVSFYINNLCLETESRVLITPTDLTCDLSSPLIIYGDNGVGKSSLCNWLYNSAAQRSNALMFKTNGTYIFSPHIHIVPQNIVLVSGDLMHNLKFGSWNQHYSETYIKELIIAVGLEHRITTTTATIYTANISLLSQGEIHKLAIVRAILHNPDIIILDETLDNLDTKSQDKIFSLLERLNIKTILVSHNRQIIDRFHNKLLIEDKKCIYNKGAFILV